MELEKNNNITNVNSEEDIDGDLLGRELKVPQCLNCIYSDGARCKKYNALKIDLSEQGIDIFNCPGFEPKKESPEIEKIKSMGFSED